MMKHIWKICEGSRSFTGEYITSQGKQVCVLAPEVTYLGYRISKDGIAPVEESFVPILKAPAPENVTQLKSFLGIRAYGVVVSMFDFHRSDRGSNPGSGGKIS